MTYRSRMFSAAVALTMLVLLGAMEGSVLANPAGDVRKEGRGNTNLTAKQRAEFIAGAKKVAGLDDEQIAKVLDNPEMIDDIPVSTKFSSRFVEAPAAEAPDTTMTQTAYAPITRRKLAILEYNDANGRLLFKTEAMKTWVFDGDRVISGSMDDVTTWIREDARYTPETGGWRYEESVEGHTDRFVPVDGRTYGGHKSTVAGRFDFFNFGDARPSSAVKQGIAQTGHYDGTCYSTPYAPLWTPKITSGPASGGYLRSTTATFGFTTALTTEEPGTTFRCSLDGGAFTSCSSPKTYGPLSQGPHTFRLQPVDAKGNAGIRSAPRTFKVDTVAPTVASTTPTSGAVGVTAGTSVAAVFSEDVEAITLIDGFTLVEASTATPVETYISYEPTTRKAVLRPAASLAPGKTYTAKVKGAAGGVTDRAGNPLAADKTWSFTTAQ